MQVPIQQKTRFIPTESRQYLATIAVVEQAEAPAYSRPAWCPGGRFGLKALAKRPDKMPLTALIPAPAESKAVS